MGLTLAIVFGTMLGLVLARFHILDVGLTVYITFLYSIPSVALVPLIVLWAGYETTAKVIILFMFAFFPMVINTYQGVKSVDPKLLEVGRAFRCSERQLWGNIVLPAALPFIVTGIRLAVGRGMIGMVLADLYTAISGIGYLIVRTAIDVPGRQDVRADRDAGPARRHADRAAAHGREAASRRGPRRARKIRRYTPAFALRHRLAERLKQRAVDRIALRVVFRVPLHAERKARRVGDPDRLDRAVIRHALDHHALCRDRGCPGRAASSPGWFRGRAASRRRRPGAGWTSCRSPKMTS